MIFNQPGHLATIIAFDLPINDIIPLNMARANFALNRPPTETPRTARRTITISMTPRRRTFTAE
ncbi:Phosphotransferase RcsD [Sodalis praecaptivus]